MSPLDGEFPPPPDARAQEKQLRESVVHLADRAAHTAVEQVFTNLGIDISNPIKAQEQFASLRRLAVMMADEKFAEDFAWLRRLRLASESAKDVSIRTIVKILVTAILGVIAIGTKDWWISHIGIGK